LRIASQILFKKHANYRRGRKGVPAHKKAAAFHGCGLDVTSELKPLSFFGLQLRHN
jgi:hypothetical protein